MDYGKAFTFFSEDERWVSKLLIAGLLSLFSFLIIPIFPLTGYAIELLQNVMRGDARPLPEWDNIGAKFMKGLNVFVIGFIYALPIILLACCFVALTSVLVPGGTNNARPNETANNLATLLILCFSCFSILYAIVVAVLAPASFTLYAVNEKLADAFRLRDVFAYIRSNASNYIVAILLSFVAGFIAQFGVIACFIGIFFTAAWAQMVTYHLLGQVYRSSLGAMPPAPSPVLTPTTPAL